MKQYLYATIVCCCLLIGSLYPKLLLQNHVKLVDQNGQEMKISEEYQEEIPVTIEFRFLKIFR